MKGFQANALVVGDGRFIRSGVAVVDGSGTVLFAGAEAQVHALFPSLHVRPVRGIIMPGLLNGHCHLELSAMFNKLPQYAGFSSWLSALRLAQEEQEEGEASTTAVRAAAHMRAQGTAFVCDVGQSEVGLSAARSSKMLAFVYKELVGLRRELSARDLRPLTQQLGSVRLSIAPHALYSLPFSALSALFTAHQEQQSIVTMHFAEHDEERLYLEDQEGPLAAWVREKYPDGAPPSPRRPLMEFARRCGALGQHALLVHGTDLREAELRELSGSGARLVLCPRSNFFIEKRYPPLPRMLAAGLKPALGTDSLASNIDLDVLQEAVILRRVYPNVPPATLVCMCTSWAAEAFGLHSTLGLIARGRRPGILHIEAPTDLDCPHSFLVEQGCRRRGWLVEPADTLEQPGVE